MEPGRAAPHPGIHLPPPFLFLGGLLVGWVLERWMVRIRPAPEPPEGAGVVLIAAGLALGGWGIVTFRRCKTTLRPVRPATTVVQTGPYRFTRNPMYAGLTLAYAGTALVLNSGWTLLLLPLVLVLLTRLVIRKEEASLNAAFGDTYRDYRRRVRRWI